MLSNPKWVKYTPVVTALLFDVGAVAQIIQMVHERSSVGQSLYSWVTVVFGLLLWVNWYRVMTPDHTLPRNTALFSAVVNLGVAYTVMYYRYFYPF